MNVATFFCLALTFSGLYAKSDYNLNGIIACVTGGTKGIGFAIVNSFLKGGAKTVYIVDKNNTRGMQAETELNRKFGRKRAVFICADVTKDLDRVTEMFEQSGVQIDTLVNSADIADENHPKETILTNSLAPMLWSQRYVEIMRIDKGGNGGTIINIASICAYTRDPFYCFFNGSKYAILGYTYCMGHKYNFLNYGVRMFAISPGSTYGDVLDHEPTVLEGQLEDYIKFQNDSKWQNPDVVGKAAAILYRTAESGTLYTVEGGEPPFLSPNSVYVSAEYLLSLK